MPLETLVTGRASLSRSRAKILLMTEKSKNKPVDGAAVWDSHHQHFSRGSQRWWCPSLQVTGKEKEEGSHQSSGGVRRPLHNARKGRRARSVRHGRLHHRTAEGATPDAAECARARAQP